LVPKLCRFPNEEESMRRSSKLLVLVAMTAALIPSISTVAAATTTVNYKIAGIASVVTFPQASFAGAAVSESRTEFGLWNAVVSQDLGAILGGTFKFRSKLHSLTESIVGGTFTTNAGGSCAKTAVAVHGVLSGGGVFDVTLTRYGSLRSGSCVVRLATVRGTASLVFPF
jgi:hypothetical protein